MPIDSKRPPQVSILESVRSLDGLNGRFGVQQKASTETPPIKSATSTSTTGTCYSFNPKPVMDQVDHFKAHPFDLDNLKSSTLEVDVPILPGNHLLPMHTGRDAHIHIPEDTVLSIQTKSDQTTGESAFKKMALSLSKPIIIHNPATALKICKNDFQRGIAWLQDQFASIEITGLNVDPITGELVPEGRIKCWGPIPDRILSAAIPAGSLPEAILGLAEIRKKKTLFKTIKKAPTGSVKPKGLGAKLRSLLLPAAFRLQAIAFPKSPDILNKLSLPAPENINLSIQGTTRIEENGFGIKICRTETPSLVSRFMRGKLSANIHVEQDPDGSWSKHGTYEATLKAEVPHQDRAWGIKHHLTTSADFISDKGGINITHGELSVEGHAESDEALNLRKDGKGLFVNDVHYPIPAPKFLDGSAAKVEAPDANFQFGTKFSIKNNKLTSHDGKFNARLGGESLSHDGLGVKLKMPRGTEIKTAADDLEITLDREHICISTSAEVEIGN